MSQELLNMQEVFCPVIFKRGSEMSHCMKVDGV
jgi:hypothetical protein